MHISIDPVTKELQAQVCALRLSSGQEHFIEPVEECLQEARQLSLWRPVALSFQGELIGFAMYGQFPQEGGRVWLDHFLIDKNFQGKGLGKAAFAALLERLVQEYRCSEIYLSLYSENTAAIRLYEKFGFRPNGETDYNGETVMVASCTAGGESDASSEK